MDDEAHTPRFKLGDKVFYWDYDDGCVSAGSVEKITISTLGITYDVAGAKHDLRERSLYTDAVTVYKKYARDLLQVYKDRLKTAEWRAREYASQADTYRQAIKDLCREHGIEDQEDDRGLK